LEGRCFTCLIDTCVWLDVAKDYRHQQTLRALEQMIKADEVTLVVPRQTVDEFAYNKERIVRDSGKSLSSTFKRVKEAVRQLGHDEGKANALASLDDVDHRITILSDAVNDTVQKIEAIFGHAEITGTSEAVLLCAGRRALERKAPFHKEKNSIGERFDRDL
jgi:PIN domain